MAAKTLHELEIEVEVLKTEFKLLKGSSDQYDAIVRELAALRQYIDSALNRTIGKTESKTVTDKQDETIKQNTERIIGLEKEKSNTDAGKNTE